MLRAEAPSEVRAVRFRGTERFQLVRLLGRGGMGVVYEAEDRELGIRVALKSLPGLEPSLLRLFKKEFRAAANIRHRNVVRFGDLFSDGERWFFTMEIVEGTDLRSYVRCQSGHLDQARVCEVFSQLAQGLAAIHATGQIHRDIKPSNVLVSRDGRVDRKSVV